MPPGWNRATSLCSGREHPAPLPPAPRVPYPGGAPANVVTCTSRLGVRSVLLGMLGTDQLGDDFVNLLKERNVETKYLQRTPDHPTRDVLVTRTADGERTFAGFGKARSEEYADCFVDAEALPADEIKVLRRGDLLVGRGGKGKVLRPDCHWPMDIDPYRDPGLLDQPLVGRVTPPVILCTSPLIVPV